MNKRPSLSELAAFAGLSLAVCAATPAHAQNQVEATPAQWHTAQHDGLPARVKQFCTSEAGELIVARSIPTETLVISANAPDRKAGPAPERPPTFCSALEFLLSFRYPAVEIDFADTPHPERPPLRVEVFEKEGRTDCWDGEVPYYLLRDLGRTRCVVARPIEHVSARYRLEKAQAMTRDDEGEVSTWETRIRDRETGELIYRYATLTWRREAGFMRFARVHHCGLRATASIPDILVPSWKNR